MPDDWTWRDDARSFFRWNAWQPIWDWFWQTRLGKAVITGVGGLVLGVIGKLYSPPVFYIGLGVVFAVLIVFGADILSAIRSRMRPVTRDEAKSIAAQIEDFLRGKKLLSEATPIPSLRRQRRQRLSVLGMFAVMRRTN
jgi:hypothetical protein